LKQKQNTRWPDDAVIIALGSNLPGGYPSLEALLEAALASLPGAGLNVVKRSSWWRSAAWPDPTLPDYLNGVAIVETALGPREVLAALLTIEAAFGRHRGEANAARTLDLDFIAHGRTVMDEPGLTLPHARAHDRLFVMGPLAQIAPAWRHPTLGANAAVLAQRARVGRDARR
jgi:2-amino-4-hydroxy-6-hydroxymethyldihydropteridine diphosphokinase